MSALVFAQLGARASVTFTLNSPKLPGFVTTIVHLAVSPVVIVCDLGLFEIAIAGVRAKQGCTVWLAEPVVPVVLV